MRTGWDSGGDAEEQQFRVDVWAQDEEHGHSAIVGEARWSSDYLGHVLYCCVSLHGVNDIAWGAHQAANNGIGGIALKKYYYELHNNDAHDQDNPRTHILSKVVTVAEDSWFTAEVGVATKIGYTGEHIDPINYSKFLSYAYLEMTVDLDVLPD